MKIIVLCAVAILAICLFASPVWAAGRLAEKDILGNWLLPENGSVIKVYQCRKYVCVKVVKVADPRRRDINNPNPRLRNRPLEGIIIANNFSRARPRSGRQNEKRSLKWRGRLYNTLDGVTYDGTLNLLNKNTITMVGCVIEGLFCEAKTFYRVNTPLPDGTIAQTDASPSRDRIVVFETPPLPVRKPAQIQLTGSLQGLFDKFLDARADQTSQTFTEDERDRLFKGFLSWLERQPAEDRNKITGQLGQ